MLNYDFVATIPEKAEGYIIYADRCTLSEQELQQLGITFKRFPVILCGCKEDGKMELKIIKEP